jgi:hypothetical protein
MLRRLSTHPTGVSAAYGIAIATVGCTVIGAAGAPFGTYLLLPSGWWESRDAITATYRWFGPPAPIVCGFLIAAGLNLRRSNAEGARSVA